MKRISDPVLKDRYIQQHHLQNHIPTAILDALELRRYETGEYIYRQGEEVRTFYILVDGKLQIDFLHRNGDQAVLSLSEPPTAIGDLEIFADFPTVRNVLVLQASTLFAGAMDVIREYGKEDPRFLRFLLNQVIRKLEFSSNLLTHTRLPLESRLARYLLVQSQRRGAILTLEKREVLAGILGTSVRHLNRVLKSLAEAGIISIRYRTLEIINSVKLTNILNEPS